MMRRVLRIVLVVVGAVWATTAFADEPSPSIQRVRGVIDRDQTWSGQIMITGDAIIDGATVTVAPGTTIEFAQAVPNAHPILTVGSPTRNGGRLVLQATADRPITFRTLADTNAGRMVVYVRGDRVAGSAPVVAPGTAPTSARTDTWRYVRFENLGYLNKGLATKTPRAYAEPAVLFYLLEPDATLTIADCVFENTSSLKIEANAPAGITVASNRFTSTQDRTSVDLWAGQDVRLARPAEIAGNSAAAAIRVHSAPAWINNNILIGRDAAIVVEESPAADLKITGNYVHNTTTDDDGRYCLNCEALDALIDGNVLRGGTTCVLSGSRRFSANVLIAQPELTSRAVRRAHTHQLVAALPAGAVFERNLLIGPAYSLLIPQAMPAPNAAQTTNAPTLIRNNVFDGLAESTRAIHVNPADRAPGILRIENNLFLRAATLVYDESRSERTIVYSDYNAAAPPPRRAFDQAAVAGLKEGQDGWAAHDIRRESVAELRLTAVPDRIPDFDSDIQSGKLTITALRERLFDAYRPLPDSPLVHAGRVDSTGESATRPSIGCCEPRSP